jgi:hypothetical protein
MSFQRGLQTDPPVFPAPIRFNRSSSAWTIPVPLCESVRLADNKTVFFMDISEKLVEPDGTIGKEVMPDGLHPGEMGYIRWADAIILTLDKLFAGKE